MTTAVSVKVERACDDEPSSDDLLPTAVSSVAADEPVILVNPLLNEFVDCIGTLPSRLQLLLSELRGIDAQVNLRHHKIQIIRQEILSKSIVSSTSKSDADNSSSASSDIDTTSEQKLHIEQLLNKLHQLLLQCQLLGDDKVKLTGQIMEILSSKTRRLGLDTKSNEERNFHVELDEEKILNEFKIAIKKRSQHQKKTQHLTAAATTTTSHRSSRQQCNAHNLQTGSSKSKQQHLNSAEINKAVAKYTKTSTSTSTTSSLNKYFPFGCNNNNNNNNNAYSFEDNNQIASLNTRLKSGSESESKSLRNLNLNLINGNKKPMRKNNFPNKSNKSKQTSKSPLSLNHRPKRQLNYQNQQQANQMSKKPRLSHLKQTSTSQLSLSLTTDNIISNCNSPSSSSTSSNHKSHHYHKKSLTIDRKSVGNKLTRVKHSKSVLKHKQQQQQREKVTRKSNNNKKLQLAGRRNENNDDADDDLSDDIDDSKDNFNDTDNSTDLENQQQQQQQQVNENDDDEELNSNETESINELDNSINGNSENDDDVNEQNNDSIVSENDDETDEDYQKNAKKSFAYTKNYESHNDENSENDSSILIKQHQSYKPGKSKSRLKSSTTAARNAAAAAAAAAAVENDLAEQEPVYCVCNEISYGNMICCDNSACSIEWFHFQCVNLHSKPKGKWYCPNCRGDSHKSMRKLT